MNRLTKPQYSCLLALAASLRSTDPHSSVGAAAFDINGRTLGTAYNGLAPGMEVPDWMFLDENRAKKALLFRHAEANLITSISGQPHIIGLTMSPCTSCAKLISATTTKQIYYLYEYENTTPEWKEVLDFYGIKHEKLNQESLQVIQEKLITQLSKTFSKNNWTNPQTLL